MALDGEEAEYESDPEDALHPAAMRRREASDDEEGDGSDGSAKPSRRDLAAGIGSDGELDGQGGAPEDDEEFDVEEEELEEEAVDDLEEEGEEEAEEEVEETEVVVKETAAIDPLVDGQHLENEGDNQAEDGEGKDKNEPFAVPTVGAFYMHDDRFRENSRGRHRHMLGARKSWETKDNRAWVHDRFEEMNLQDVRNVEQRRMPKGRFRGHGETRNRGNGRGNVRGINLRFNDETNNQHRPSRSMRGRGPRRYESLPKNNSDIPATHSKQYTKSHESTSSASAGRQSPHISNVQPDRTHPHKHTFASSLNSASPPFYPSGASTKDISVTQKRNTQTGSTSRSVPPNQQVDSDFSASQPGSLLRGKGLVGSVSHDKGYMNDSISPVTVKLSGASQVQSLGSHSSLRSQTHYHSKSHGRGITINGAMNDQSATSLSQITSVSNQAQTPFFPQKPVQIPSQTSLRVSTQKMGHRPGNGTQTSSPHQDPSANSSDVEETGSSLATSNYNAGKGKIINQGGSDRGPFIYSGTAQVLGAAGAMGLPHGDQSFPAAPALLPVMQFGGQHHGGHGVPAMGMALPGYVAQPQLGFGNSEMTWVPVLAGAAGALGSPYCSPYIALDSSGFYARTSGQISSSTSSSREVDGTKPANTRKIQQEPDLAEALNDKFGQRQNKPRRYSEMNFGQ